MCINAHVFGVLSGSVRGVFNLSRATSTEKTSDENSSRDLRFWQRNEGECKLSCQFVIRTCQFIRFYVWLHFETCAFERVAGRSLAFDFSRYKLITILVIGPLRTRVSSCLSHDLLLSGLFSCLAR